MRKVNLLFRQPPLMLGRLCLLAIVTVAAAGCTPLEGQVEQQAGQEALAALEWSDRVWEALLERNATLQVTPGARGTDYHWVTGNALYGDFREPESLLDTGFGFGYTQGVVDALAAVLAEVSHMMDIYEGVIANMEGAGQVTELQRNLAVVRKLSELHVALVAKLTVGVENPPPEEHVTAGQLRDIVLLYMEENPRDRGLPAAQVVWRALADLDARRTLGEMRDQ
jgi:hypothetical protein